MGKINVLTKEIAELIAAGEVIERPSSVAKELLENAIDSNANIITVEIKNGGISYLRVTDNGCGIASEDISLAFIRHATSKVLTKDDLDYIMTLGFRGEALASISAVAKVDVISKCVDDELGTHYVIEGSEEKLNECCGCPDGTTIAIRDIFYNVPARLKFMKKAVTEGNAVAAVVNKLALSHPEISFKFIRDNKVELITPGDMKLYSAIFAVYGSAFAKNLIEVDYTYNDIEVKGFVSKPLAAKANRAFQNFFINNRYIKSVTCTVSLEEAYKNQIMTGKFPACVLNLTLSPDKIDVNVHPAKIEVRFSDEKLIFDAVYFAVKNALLTFDTPNELKISEPQYKSFQKTSIFNNDDNDVVEQTVLENSSVNDTVVSNKSDSLQDSTVTFAKQSLVINELKEHCEDTVIDMLDEKKVYEQDNRKLESFSYISAQSFAKNDIVVNNDISKDENEFKAVDVKIIGEVFKTYILCEVENELVMIDKHAAHERYIFEKIKSGENRLTIQMLLEPVDILLSEEGVQVLIDNKDKLSLLGFSVKSKDINIVSVMGIPSIVNNEDIECLVTEIADNFILHKNNPGLDIVDELYHSIACKSAIKANDINDKSELISLVKKIYNDKIKYCPHGRPVLITLTKKEIEKQFKRRL